MNTILMFKCLLEREYVGIILPIIGISVLIQSIKWVIKNL